MKNAADVERSSGSISSDSASELGRLQGAYYHVVEAIDCCKWLPGGDSHNATFGEWFDMHEAIASLEHELGKKSHWSTSGGFRWERQPGSATSTIAAVW